MIHFSLLLLAHDGATGQNVDAGSGSSLDYKYIWDSSQAEAYQAALELEDIKVAFRNLQTGISSAETAEAINSNVCSFQRVMDSVCAPLFKRNVKQFSNEYTFNESKQPWFNDECREKRNVFYRCLDIFRSSKPDVNSRKNMVNARSEYKKVLRRCRYEYRKSQTGKLVNYRSENAKNYWKLLKNLCPSSSSKKVNSQQFAKYFKAVNDPESRFFQADKDVLYYNERYVKGELEVMFQELDVRIS